MLKEKIKEITALLNKKIEEGLVIESEYIYDSFVNLLTSVNDDFYIDIDIVLNYNCFPIYYLILSISYEEDSISENEDRVEYIFNYVEEDDKDLKITSIEEIRF